MSVTLNNILNIVQSIPSWPMGVTTFGVARPELSELDSESELEDEEDDDESLDFE